VSPRRVLWIAAVVVALAWTPRALQALGLLDAGTHEEEASAETWAKRGDEAFADGRFAEAARAFTFAFRLLDPTPLHREVRALLAFKKARALAEQALGGESEWPPAALADGAFFWFEQARSLGPSLRAVSYERARLFDSDIEDVGNPEHARAEYERYLAETEAAGVVPEGEAQRVAHARERVAALSAKEAPGD
jgi:hypothetical protein